MSIFNPRNVQIRFDELKMLQVGWLDGKGDPPAHIGLDWFAKAFDSYYPDDIPLPYLFPTLEGRILAEWTLKPWAPSLEIDLVQKRAEWHLLNIDTDEEFEKQLDLAKSADWKWLGEEVRTLGRQMPQGATLL